jgi:flagellar hook-associated protein 1 FlgK
VSAFDIIRLAMSGLAANQKAIDVTGQNVANVNTPGYHRQEAVMRAGQPQKPIVGGLTPSSLPSTGVDVQQVRRVQDGYLQQQFNNVMGQFGRWGTMSQQLQQLESFLAPGSELNLTTMLDRFFSAWQQLATHPEEEGTRSLVVGESSNLATLLNTQASQLTSMRVSMDSAVEVRVARVNLLVDELASMNAKIGEATGMGMQPNDLMDQREVIYSELASLVGTTSLSTDDTAPIINLNGYSLVQGGVGRHLLYQTTATGRQITWDDGTPVTVSNGEIAALTQMRDTVIPDYLAQLDAIASGLSTSVNALHRTGFGMDGMAAPDFFTGASAGSIVVNAALVDDPSLVAATTTAGAVGDGSLATRIAQLAHQPLIGNQTMQEAASTLLSNIGHAVRGARTSTEAASAMKEQLANQVMATSGVSMDEEMTNMIIYQRAYDASARVLTVADEMLRTLIERIGA